MEIQPEKQNLDQTFSNTVYHIDFYQRSYKWDEEPVQRLFDDILYEFEESWKKNPDLDPNRANIDANYPWYYLNTYVTNTVEGRVFVVDGQQRLTTLTLTLIKLAHMAQNFNSPTGPWLESRIAGYSGMERSFWMNHEGHIDVLRALLQGDDPSTIDVASGVTAENLVANFQTISHILDAKIQGQRKFEVFVHYFLYRLVLINLSVDTTHVPMVFEVINDRGVRLKPHEILKGKLLGQIDKRELAAGRYNELWDEQVERLNRFGPDTIDSFFRSWLKAKFAASRGLGVRFDGDYHREIFKRDLNDLLNLDHNALAVKKFIAGEFQYFSSLYNKVLAFAGEETSRFPAVFFNGRLTDMNTQMQLIMSACVVNDPEEDEKIALVSEGLDRAFSLLRLQGQYDSNEFVGRIYEMSAVIREQPADKIRDLLDQQLLAELEERRKTGATELFSYQLFRPMTVDRLTSRFARYFFGRVERYMAQGMGREMKHSIYDLVARTGTRNGFHIEHVLSYNDVNLGHFDGNEELFEVERNRLGAVLLLRGRDNISSSNEPYDEKLRSYANTLYWNETLREDTYKSKLDFLDFTRRESLNFRPLETFGLDEVEARHRLLFEVSKRIWDVV
ncbi:hypothetical protein AU252_05140 [Pseudarthrobacter sulfonivorans]|uniref:DUF262 domain-containing protein n=1 Tax=Pseudarthrobacter sulfonivorans TaxID=121292 RepID=A0A0U3QVP9_9MICC|nr:DUF262 domain-containing protein [Pseudarthrobacter sulfonivorans]ALV43765.1 hypothetical protein AU252_05140 [Pseudarthrobacter sulfonivorans]